MNAYFDAVEVADDDIAVAEPEIDAPIEEKPDEEVDLKRLSQKKPPTGGMCRRCGENKPINRLMLCYPCWVKTVLEKDGWREGQPHPDWCKCEGSKDHVRKSDGN